MVFHSSTITMMHGPINIRSENGYLVAEKYGFLVYKIQQIFEMIS